MILIQKVKIQKSITMKVIRCISVVIIVFLYACGSGGDKSQTATNQTLLFW